MARNSFFTQPFKISINFLGSALPPKSEASTADPRNLSQSAAKKQKGKKAKKAKKMLIVFESYFGESVFGSDFAVAAF